MVVLHTCRLTIVFKLPNLVVERFRRLERSDEKQLEQVTTSVVKGEEGAGKTREAVLMESIKRVMFFTVNVTLSRWVQRYRFVVQRRQEKRAVVNHVKNTCRPGACSWSVSVAYLRRRIHSS